LAGLLWVGIGPATTFLTGAVFAGITGLPVFAISIFFAATK